MEYQIVRLIYEMFIDEICIAALDYLYVIIACVGIMIPLMSIVALGCFIVQKRRRKRLLMMLNQGI